MTAPSPPQQNEVQAEAQQVSAPESSSINSGKTIFEMLHQGAPLNSAVPTPTAVALYAPPSALHRPLSPETLESLPYTMHKGVVGRSIVPWSFTSSNPPSEPPINYNWLSESCAGRATLGVIGGGVMGAAMGLFLGAMSDLNAPVTMIHGREVPQAPLREQAYTTFRATGDKMVYWTKSFAFITGVFGGTECLVEKARGQHDVWNPVISGCVTGAALQAKSGPSAAAIGCGGFAAFSLVIDKIMGTH